MTTVAPLLYIGEPLAAYAFPGRHPFGGDRQEAFLKEARRRGLDRRARIVAPVQATREEIERFHTGSHVERVMRLSYEGHGSLDGGDTPAFPGMYDAAAFVVGSALDGLRRVMRGEAHRTLQPIGGLHHARRDRAAGFCVFNDCGVAIETLRREYRIRRVAYVDIDVHHGDGIFYEYEDDPDLAFVDIHQDGNTIYPGSGHAHETGRGAAKDTKLNLPLAPGAGDAAFLAAWEKGEALLRRMKPQFVLFQCGADSIEGDPLGRLALSPAAHGHVARRLCALADEFADGRLMCFGGGGYNRANLANAWCAVLEALVDSPTRGDPPARHEQE